MASRPYFIRGSWYVKWKSPDGWKSKKLCGHPGWSKGQARPKKAPAEAVHLARVWADREEAVRRGADLGLGRKVDLRAFLDR